MTSGKLLTIYKITAQVPHSFISSAASISQVLSHCDLQHPIRNHDKIRQRSNLHPKSTLAFQIGYRASSSLNQARIQIFDFPKSLFVIFNGRIFMTQAHRASWHRSFKFKTADAQTAAPTDAS